MATARLRRAFKYPADDKDANEPREMDEEEQEKLIHSLRQHHEKGNNLYRRIFLVINVACAMLFIPGTLGTSHLRNKALCLLSLLALLLNACAFRPKRIKSSRSDETETAWEAFQPYASSIGGLSAVISGISAYNVEAEDALEEVLRSLCWTPLLMSAVGHIAARFMNAVDLDELEKLKYGYKGA